MNWLKITLAALIVLLGAAGALQWRMNQELRSEIAVLRAEARHVEDNAVAADAVGTARQANDRTEIANLRAEVDTLKTQAKQFAQVAKAVQAARAKAEQKEAAPVLNLIPSSAWKNAGKTAPAATLETVFWAAAGGDVDTMTEMIAMGAKARERAAALFASLPESTQAQYGSPEKLVALFVAQGASPVTAMQVLGTKPGDDPGETEMSVMLQNASGGMKKDDFTIRQYPDGWRFMISASTVDKIARHLSGAQTTAK